MSSTYSPRAETSTAAAVSNPEASARAMPVSTPQVSPPKPSNQQGVSQTLGHDSSPNLPTPKAASRSHSYTLSKASWTVPSPIPSPSPSEDSLLTHPKDNLQTDKLTSVLSETTTTSTAVSNHSPTPQPVATPNVMQPSHAPDPSQVPHVTPRPKRSTPPASSSQSIDQTTPQQSSASPTASTNAPSPSKDAKAAASKRLSLQARFLHLAALDKQSYKRQSQSKTATVQSPGEAGGGSAPTDTVTTATSDQVVVKPSPPPDVRADNPPESIPEDGTVERIACSAHPHSDAVSWQNAELHSRTPSVAIDQPDTSPALAHSSSGNGSQLSDAHRPGTQLAAEKTRVRDAVPTTPPSPAGGNVGRKDTFTSETPGHNTFREVSVYSDISLAGVHPIQGAIPMESNVSREASVQSLSYPPNLYAPMLGTEPGSLPSRTRNASELDLSLFDSSPMSQRPPSGDNDKDASVPAVPQTDGLDSAPDVVQDSAPTTPLHSTEAQLTFEDSAASPQNMDIDPEVPALAIVPEPRSHDVPTPVSGDVVEKHADVGSEERSAESDVLVSLCLEPRVADSLAPAADNQDVVMLDPSQSVPTVRV